MSSTTSVPAAGREGLLVDFGLVETTLHAIDSARLKNCAKILRVELDRFIDQFFGFFPTAHFHQCERFIGESKGFVVFNVHV